MQAAQPSWASKILGPPKKLYVPIPLMKEPQTPIDDNVDVGNGILENVVTTE